MCSAATREDSSPLTIMVTPDQDVVWIEVCGDVDLATHSQLRSTLEGVDLGGASAVQLDLRRLAFCDSRGCEILLAFERRALAAGAHLQLRGLTPGVRKLMRVVIDEVARDT